LNTTNSNNRLKLQYELKNMCDKTIIYSKPKKILDLLIKHGANLNFTIDYEGLEKTPLMSTVKSNFTIFKLLLKKGALLNTPDSRGLTVLNIATEYPIDTDYLKVLLENPTLIINQQNNCGETALLHC